MKTYNQALIYRSGSTLKSLINNDKDLTYCVYNNLVKLGEVKILKFASLDYEEYLSQEAYNIITAYTKDNIGTAEEICQALMRMGYAATHDADGIITIAMFIK